MSRKKLSAKELDALDRDASGSLRYPPEGARPELRLTTTKPKLRRRKRTNEGGT